MDQVRKIYKYLKNNQFFNLIKNRTLQRHGSKRSITQKLCGIFCTVFDKEQI
jgi:hypothetical protein